MSKSLIKLSILFILFSLCLGIVSASEIGSSIDNEHLFISDSNQELSDSLVSDDLGNDLCDNDKSSNQDSNCISDLEEEYIVQKSFESKVKESSIVGAGNTIFVGENTTENGDGSQSNPFNNLKLALDAAEEYDIIKINDGNYTGENNRDLIVKSGISIEANGENVNFMSNSTIFNVTGDNVLIKGLSFINSNEPSSLIKISGNYGTVDGCNFINCSSSVNITGNNGLVNNSKFEGRVYVLHNSVVFLYGENCIVNNSDFESYYGQSVNSKGNGTIIQNCNFVNGRYIAGEGSGVLLNASHSLVDNCNFTDLNGQQGVTALFILGDFNNVSNSNFKDNYADAAGVMDIRGSGNNIDHCSFINNTARYYGGGAITSHGNNNISYSNFTNNSGMAYGGALCMAFANIDHCSFINNTAIHGSAIYVLEANVSNSYFEGNHPLDEADYSNHDAVLAFNNLNLNQNAGLNEDSQKATSLNLNVNEYVTGMYQNLVINGYHTYCAEEHKYGAYDGYFFDVDEKAAKNIGLFYNSKNGKYVLPYLKILIYLVESRGITESQQQNIWTFTDMDYIGAGMEDGEYKDNLIGDVLRLYDSGFNVNDTQDFIDEEGNRLFFDFKAVVSFYPRQNLFMYKLFKETINKTTENKTVIAGDIIEYTITVSNGGTDFIENAYVIEKFSSDELEYAGYRNGTGNWIFYPDEMKWVLDGKLYRNLPRNFTVYFKALRNGTFYNNVSCGFDNNLWNDASETVTILDYNMSLEKIALDPIVVLGNQTRFEIIVHNIGQLNLTNVTVIEDDYGHLIYDSFLGEGWIEFVNDLGKHQFNYTKQLNPGDSINFTVIFNATELGNFTNFVVAYSDKTNEITASNKTGVFNASLDVQKIALNESVRPGEKTQFLIVVNNTGDIQLENVFVEEMSFDGLEYDSFLDESGKWIFDGNNRWHYNDTLDIGASSNFTVIFKTLTEGNFTNIVCVGSDFTNVSLANDTVKAFKIENETDNNSSGDNKSEEANSAGDNESTSGNSSYKNKKTSGSDDKEKTAEDSLKDNKEETGDKSDEGYKNKSSSKTIIKSTVKADSSLATGNPVYVLILAIFALFIPLRFKKE